MPESDERGGTYIVKGRWKAIAAMSRNRVIGQGNAIPWRIPEDLKWFKALTMGQMIVMGRKTFESIGKPLPGRRTVVLSRGPYSPGHGGVEVVHGLDALPAAHEGQAVFICGGAEIYEQALPLCEELYLTVVNREVEGDAYFPRFEDMFEAVEVLARSEEFTITRYRNRRFANGVE